MREKKSLKMGQGPCKEIQKAGGRKRARESGSQLKGSGNKSQRPNQSSHDSGTQSYCLKGL